MSPHRPFQLPAATVATATVSFIRIYHRAAPPPTSSAIAGDWTSVRHCRMFLRADGSGAMDFAFSEKSQRMQAAVRQFMDKHVAPRDGEFAALENQGVFPPPFMEELKAKARAQGLWN